MARGAAIVGLLIWVTTVGSAGAAPLDGPQLFLHKCGFCHQFRDLGQARIGPDLTQRVNGMDAGRIVIYVRSPRSIDPQSRMPGQRGLSDQQLAAIAQFLTTPVVLKASSESP